MPTFASLGNASARGFGSRGAIPGLSVVYPTDSSFVHIETLTVASGQTPATLDFTSIPGTYKHLQLRTMLRSTRVTDPDDFVGIRFNGSSTTYTRQVINSRTHTTVAGVLYDSSTYAYCIGMASASGAVNSSVYGFGVVDIPEYTSTTVRKSFSVISGSEQGATTGLVGISTLHWPVASAITSISLLCNNLFVAGSTASLYGIKDS